ncbi:hypothetical protein RvY_10698 [Ramazzottius varieornatus]|uniref:Uncharacterized protein n=1 Tax=Ramazzottius varieornatus TaxID=947166 RepID=A0A1D1VI38_RAMVA|nr:hypothetical protein RvY_10698 [Ramazzottius varieornatus]
MAGLSCQTLQGDQPKSRTIRSTKLPTDQSHSTGRGGKSTTRKTSALTVKKTTVKVNAGVPVYLVAWKRRKLNRQTHIRMANWL